MLLDWYICKLIMYWISIKTQAEIAETLSLLEYGVSHYVRKLMRSYAASPNPDLNLVRELGRHGIDERSHGKMLATISKNVTYITYSYNWIKLKDKTYKRVEGVSSYPWMRVILSGHKLSDFSFNEQLVIMTVLESLAHKFYECFSVVGSPPLSMVAETIANQEKHHQNYLWKYAKKRSGIYAWILKLKWYWKIFKTVPIIYKELAEIEQINKI